MAFHALPDREVFLRRRDVESLKTLLPANTDFTENWYKPHGKYESFTGRRIQSLDPGQHLGRMSIRILSLDDAPESDIVSKALPTFGRHSWDKILPIYPRRV
jgi:hypothetical protein